MFVYLNEVKVKRTSHPVLCQLHSVLCDKKEMYRHGEWIMSPLMK